MLELLENANIKMDVIGVSGLIVSIAGFGLALWQLGRTRRAAEAAMKASQDAITAIRHVHSIANIQDICGRSRDLLNHARTKNLQATATAAFELRDLVARFHATDSGRKLTTEHGWTEILRNIASTHERLESAAAINRIDVQEKETLLHNISSLHSQFSSFAATTADAGVTNANS